MSTVPLSEWERVKLAVWTRDGFRCCYCGRSAGTTYDQWEAAFLTVDHFQPEGGGSDDNLKTACYLCNLIKGPPDIYIRR
jgi:5-methylcytosine-specific restriction endonuclease McrA